MTDETPGEATPEDPQAPQYEPPDDEPAEWQAPEWTSRNRFRAGLVAALSSGLIAHQRTIESGPLEGLEVVSAGHIAEVLATILREPLPPPTGRHAEVITPADLLVTAVCPRCGQPAELLLTVTPQLVVDSDGGELRLKSHTKGRTHICGQLPLPRDVGEGQGSFELGDIVPDADHAITGSEAVCPFPGCVLAEEHEGDHYVPTDGLDDDPPTLPTP